MFRFLTTARTQVPDPSPQFFSPGPTKVPGLGSTMPKSAQYNYNTPIGFSQKNGIPTKGGSVNKVVGHRSKVLGPDNNGEDAKKPTPYDLRPTTLSPLEERLFACLVEVASAFNLPRSMGEIFGLIYASEEPVCFEGVRERLGLSKASTSTGLKHL
jgi:hypothetical protein